MTECVRVLLVDDHSQVHRALSAINDIVDNVALIGHASNGAEAVQLCDQLRPDVVIMDVVMPIMNGIEATRQITHRFPEIKVLALSSFQDEDSVRDMMGAGAVGYILKNSSIEDLVHTVWAAYTGKTIFSPEVTQILMQPSASPPKPEPIPDYGLTAREQEVLALMVRGDNNKAIAYALTISEATAKFHVRGILSKLNVTSRVEAVALAVEKHLVR